MKLDYILEIVKAKKNIKKESNFQYEINQETKNITYNVLGFRFYNIC